MLTALVLFPLLILGDQWHNHQIVELRHHEAKAAVAIVVGVVLVIALAWVFRRWPVLMPLSIIGTLPFRIPLESGGETANLLVPLYVVIAAGVLAAMFLPPPAEKRRPRWVAKTLAIFVVLYALQALYSEDYSKGLQEVCFFLVPFTLAYILLRELPWDRRLLVWALILVTGEAIAFVLIGSVEYVSRSLFWNQAVIRSNEFHTYFRVNSIFWDPNIYGRYLALVLVVVTAAMMWIRERRPFWLLCGGDPGALARPRPDLQPVELHRPARRPRGAGGAALVAGAGRSGVVVVGDRRRGAGRPPRRRQEAHLGPPQRRHLRPRATWSPAAPNSSPNGRCGATAPAPSRRPTRTTCETEKKAPVTISHTEPVTVGAEQGLIGLAAYVALVVVSLWTMGAGLWARGPDRDPPYVFIARAAVLAAFVALLVHTMAYAGFFQDPITWVLMAIGASLAAAAQRRARPRACGRDAAVPDRLA